MRTYSQQQRERATARAARRLMRHGLHPGNQPLLSKLAIAWLADIAAHVNSLDPMVIGAAALLESSGYDPQQRATRPRLLTAMLLLFIAAAHSVGLVQARRASILARPHA